ncbi:hypothetical protein [Stackebrandtia nassauensis]|uniref:Uncharacterized protein n=1 Tax=Stackebrandtia nassauensis (strain DSM 44728 / CIP 108903 / NRRL B-16338 / NBRC 102104 / LLR-40K-21) TaxID=446470 RepID=D3PXD6_STANL|nr:hypothetical protein [Stackebrandtia nassauensis]ADD41399.1 hypothetical protein Snas_1700 [Stackebrandtia nassauensis DSM 44728]
MSEPDWPENAYQLRYLCLNDAVRCLRQAGLEDHATRLFTLPVDGESPLNDILDALGWRQDYEEWRADMNLRGCFTAYPGRKARLRPVYGCPLDAELRCGRELQGDSTPPPCGITSGPMRHDRDEFAG